MEGKATLCRLSCRVWTKSIILDHQCLRRQAGRRSYCGGLPTSEGDSNSVQAELQGADKIYSTKWRVVTWGHAAFGGNSSSVNAQLQGVDTMYSTNNAFAARLADGRVVAWGLASHGWRGQQHICAGSAAERRHHLLDRLCLRGQAGRRA